MGDEPIGDVAHAERRELDALRRRAYGPDADIHDDAPALARLGELEDRLRVERLALELERIPLVDRDEGDQHASSPAAETDPRLDPVVTVTTPTAGRPRRWRPGIIAIAVAVTVAIGGIAWSGIRDEPANELADGAAKTSSAQAEYAVGYQRLLDDLRDDLLALPGVGTTKPMIRDQLRPYGLMYGRAVGVGPTLDHHFCMIIADLPVASVTCISDENAYANPVSITLSSWYPNSVRDQLGRPGDLVSYTLMPGGSVVAARAE